VEPQFGQGPSIQAMQQGLRGGMGGGGGMAQRLGGMQNALMGGMRPQGGGFQGYNPQAQNRWV